MSHPTLREFPSFCVSAENNQNQEVQFIDFEVAYNRRYSYEVEAIYVCVTAVEKDRPRLPDEGSGLNATRDSVNKAFLILSPKSPSTLFTLLRTLHLDHQKTYPYLT